MYASIPLQNLSMECFLSKVEMKISLLYGGSPIGSQNYNWRLHFLVNHKLSKIYIIFFGVYLSFLCACIMEFLP